jgi:molybdate transport system permease protein
MNDQISIVSLSLRIAFAATLLILPAGVFLGWLFSRKNFWGKSLIDGLVSVPLVLPPVVSGYFLLVVFGPNGWAGKWLANNLGISLAFTWKAAVLAAAIVSLPLLVRAVHVAVDAVDPKLEQAARMLRASEWRIFFAITLRLASNGVIAGAVLAFARALGEFGATIIFASNIPGKTQTIPLAIFTYINQPDGEAKAQTLVLISIALAYVSILVNEMLLRRVRHAQRSSH